MSNEKSLIVVKENRFNKVITCLRNFFFKDKIKKKNIYENINILEQQLEELKKQDIENKMVQVSIKTTENRIAFLNYRASLKKTKKKNKIIIVE